VFNVKIFNGGSHGPVSTLEKAPNYAMINANHAKYIFISRNERLETYIKAQYNVIIDTEMNDLIGPKHVKAI